MFLHVPLDDDYSILSKEEMAPQGYIAADASDIAENFFLDVLAAHHDWTDTIKPQNSGIDYKAIGRYESAPRGEIESYLRAVHCVEGQDKEMFTFCCEVEPHVRTILNSNPAYLEYATKHCT